MKIFIQPNDVLFFRDGRPFEAGGDHIARLSFPPTPITFYGALRTALISLELKNFDHFKDSKALSEDLKRIVGFAEIVDTDSQEKLIYKISNGSLRITSFGLGIILDGKVRRLYPVPADVVKIKNEDTYLILYPEKLSDKEMVNMPINELIPLSNKHIDSKFLEKADGFLTEDGLNNYLKNLELKENHFIRISDIYEGEPRVSIARDFKTHAAKEGMLYSIEFARLNKETGFLIELEGLNNYEEKIKQQKAIRLGGESKSATCYFNLEWNEPVSPGISENFKLVTLTHSIFKNGWMPDGIKNDGTGNIGGVDVKLISAAMEKYVGIGGWDLVNNKSKPVRRSVPAGSVYYFKATKSNMEMIKSNQFINIGQETEKGLGQAIIGGYLNV